MSYKPGNNRIDDTDTYIIQMEQNVLNDVKKMNLSRILSMSISQHFLADLKGPKENIICPMNDVHARDGKCFMWSMSWVTDCRPQQYCIK